MTVRLHRAPAVPLVTFDPYTSVWSCADKLTDDWSRHWTGTKMALYLVARIDGVAYRLMGGPEWHARAAEQISCVITATRTTYVLRCDTVDVELEFLTPLLVDDLDLMSRPVSYLTVTARGLDTRAHDVSIYADMSGEWCVNLPHERVFWSRHERDGVTAMAFRHEVQPVLAKAGDHQRIDWGMAFLAGRTDHVTVSEGDIDLCRDAFVRDGTITARGLKPAPRKVDYNCDAVIALTFKLPLAPNGTASETIYIAYDDEYAIELFGKKLRAWWRRDGRIDGLGVLTIAMREQEQVRARCIAFDDQLSARAQAIAGNAYADLLALAWRQTIAAHKLCAGPNGEPLFFSKENFSNGCIATVDVTYPSAPLFLAYNPGLLRAMIDPYFAYCASPEWPFKFAAHDLGTYPKANGQTYRGFDKDKTQDVIETQMPVEECGNMLILVGALAKAENSTDYAAKHWAMLTQWAEYLVEIGADSGEQLCTDDFSGVLGHNVNLTGKAAMGLACYAMLAEKLGKAGVARTYRGHAETFVAHIFAAARDGDGTRLAFDQAGSWSIKYNLIWDRILGLGLVPVEEARREVAFYRTKAEAYGVPLDSRSTLTKPEWMLWAASLADDSAAFRDCVERIVRYANTTPNRVPFSDLYFTDNARKIGFQARSVLGGLFVGLLFDRS